jgi:hypothetical protein
MKSATLSERTRQDKYIVKSVVDRKVVVRMGGFRVRF